MKRVIKILLPVISVPAFLIYIASCFTPYFPPYTFWPFTFLSLAFPFIAAGIFVLIVLWFFTNKKVSLALFILFFAGYKNLGAVFACNFPSEFNYVKDSSHLRIISWNVKYLGNPSKYADSINGERRQMINYIKKVNADVLLIQEFRQVDNPAIFSNVEVLRDTLGYKYFYANNDFILNYPYGTSFEGCAIFSKFPLIDTGKVHYPNISSNESVAFADINFHGKQMRLFTTHLLSMSLFNADEVKQEGRFINKERLLSHGRSRYYTLRKYDSIHSRQAEFYASIIKQSPYPVIASGDFNSLPSTYVYHTIKGDLQDAFLKKGSGFGQTYIALSPTLRIDYILADPAFRVVQFTSPSSSTSDHFPIVADFIIR